MTTSQIELRGVRVHNLQHIDLDIPHGQWLSICGVSGSGKTSLALDTLYAEGQRRYVESLSPVARQNLPQLDRPEATRLEGIPPTIAIRSRRLPFRDGTIGEVAGIDDLLQGLFSAAAIPYCPACGREVRRDYPSEIARRLAGCDHRMLLAFPVSADRPSPAAWAEEWIRLGFQRALVDGQLRRLEEVAAESAWNAEGNVAIVVDRFRGNTDPARLQEAVETAYLFGEGQAIAWIEGGPEQDLRGTLVEIDDQPWTRLSFNRQLVCSECGTVVLPAEPRLFRANSPLGACSDCAGRGSVENWDLDRIVPDLHRTLNEGAIDPWRGEDFGLQREAFNTFAASHGIPLDLPFAELSTEARRAVLEGVPDAFPGVLADLEQRWHQARTRKARSAMARWRSPLPCRECGGSRLNASARAYRLGPRSWSEWVHLPIAEARRSWEQLCASKTYPELAPLLQRLVRRLRYLDEIGLGYLALSRPLASLSRGEVQRVILTSALGSDLVNMLYVLDEPSVGLHPADLPPVTTAIGGIRERGNSVVVVDHQPAVILAGDRVLEFGPEAGTRGGEIVFDGTPEEMREPAASLTGDFLEGRRGISCGGPHRRPARGRLKLNGARGRHLQNLDIEFPLGNLCVVSGVSGAGKTSLVRDTLYPALGRRLRKKLDHPGLPCGSLFGDSNLEDVILVDDQPLGVSARSNPVTYVKVFDEIRKAYAETVDARTRNLQPGDFSFNVDGGRCPKCLGTGRLEIDMQFLSDVTMVCDQCEGRRYRDRVLAARYRGRNIAETLELTVREAFSFFRGHPRVQARLKTLIDVGLDYIQLGQPADTLSAGEAQRLKLAQQLNATKRKTLFLLDEPTAGLHPADVIRLLDCLEGLLAVGHSLIVIEHNPMFIRFADWIIELGPGPGPAGGAVIAAGTPEQISGIPDSPTGVFLKPLLARENESN